MSRAWAGEFDVTVSWSGTFDTTLAWSGTVDVYVAAIVTGEPIGLLLALTYS